LEEVSDEKEEEIERNKMLKDDNDYLQVFEEIKETKDKID